MTRSLHKYAYFMHSWRNVKALKLNLHIKGMVFRYSGKYSFDMV